jgi:hypothetical protein
MAPSLFASPFTARFAGLIDRKVSQFWSHDIRYALTIIVTEAGGHTPTNGHDQPFSVPAS